MLASCSSVNTKSWPGTAQATPKQLVGEVFLVGKLFLGDNRQFDMVISFVPGHVHTSRASLFLSHIHIRDARFLASPLLLRQHQHGKGGKKRARAR